MAQRIRHFGFPGQEIQFCFCHTAVCCCNCHSAIFIVIDRRCFVAVFIRCLNNPSQGIIAGFHAVSKGIGFSNHISKGIILIFCCLTQCRFLFCLLIQGIIAVDCNTSQCIRHMGQVTVFIIIIEGLFF